MIVVISGPGGVGKGTLVRRLVADDPALVLSRSWTTRARRPGEADDAYTFVDRVTFAERIASGGFLEWAEYLGNLYGTPTPDPASDPTAGGVLILEIEVQGAAQVLQRVPGAVMIAVLPPSRAAQEARLRARGDTDAEVSRRLAKAEEEERIGRELAQHVVVNDDLDRAVAELAGILTTHRLSPGGA